MTAPQERPVAVGQWLGTRNRITSLRWTKHGWVAHDSTGEDYCQRTPPGGSLMVWCPDGLRTFDSPAEWRRDARPSPWPPAPAAQERPVWTGEPCRTCDHSPHNHYGSPPAHCALFGCGCPAYDGGPQERPVAGDGLARIAAERRRQVEAEGWTPEHDTEHDEGEMVQAAREYAAVAMKQVQLRWYGDDTILNVTAGWPWHPGWWKPSDDPIHFDAVPWRVAETAIEKAKAAEAEVERLRTLLTDLVVAESDAAVRRRLWKALHAASDQASDEVYPLRTEGGAS